MMMMMMMIDAILNRSTKRMMTMNDDVDGERNDCANCERSLLVPAAVFILGACVRWWRRYLGKVGHPTTGTTIVSDTETNLSSARRFC